MAREVRTILIDDLDGTESDDVETIPLGLDGVNYEIDLTAKNATRLRDELKIFVASGRRVHATRRGKMTTLTRGAGYTPRDAREKNNATREWWTAYGSTLNLPPVTLRGRIPIVVVQAYDEHNGQAPAAPETEAPPRKRAHRKVAPTATFIE